MDVKEYKNVPLLDHHLFAVVDINALGGGFAVQTAAVEHVPA